MNDTNIVLIVNLQSKLVQQGGDFSPCLKQKKRTNLTKIHQKEVYYRK